MLLKIIEPGWETFTGNLHGVDFENGLSTEHCSARAGQMIAGLIRVETLEGKNPSISQTIIDTKATPMDADMVMNADTGELTTGKEVAKEPAKPQKKWTMPELEAIIEKDGINGLRLVADPLGLKGRSIAELVEAILKATENVVEDSGPTWGVNQPGDRVGGCDEDAHRRARIAEDAATPEKMLTPVEEIKE